MPESRGSSLTEQMVERYGQVIGNRDLYRALGYKTYSAFYRARQMGVIEVGIFSLPGRRGWFSLTVDIARWLQVQADCVKSSIESINSGNQQEE